MRKPFRFIAGVSADVLADAPRRVLRQFQRTAPGIGNTLADDWPECACAQFLDEPRQRPCKLLQRAAELDVAFLGDELVPPRGIREKRRHVERRQRQHEVWRRAGQRAPAGGDVGGGRGAESGGAREADEVRGRHGAGLAGRGCDHPRCGAAETAERAGHVLLERIAERIKLEAGLAGEVAAAALLSRSVGLTVFGRASTTSAS